MFTLKFILNFVRAYLSAFLLIGCLAIASISTIISGTGPIPQYPPEQYVVERDLAVLRWNKGTREGQIDLEVSINDSTFSNDNVKVIKKVNSTHSLRKLKNGTTYYWRLKQKGKYSRVASFRVSKYNVNI